MNNIKIITANKSNKQALMDWEDFRQQISNATTIDLNETTKQKAERIKTLEANPEAWIKYYFPKYCFCEPAQFHKSSTKKVLKAKRLRQSRRWFRGASKSTRRMFEVFYKMLVQKFRVNCLMVSKTYENGERLLAPYMVNLDSNQRIINDYGEQERPGKWTTGEFSTRGGNVFRAVGAEQNPRGAKLEELRVTVIIFDDVDDDEVCRNSERVRQRWEWIERAVIPTVDISGDYLIFFDNNIIAEESCATKFAELAEDVETINIRDGNGKSSWPEKNSEKDIDDILNAISYESGQQEYFNNPIRQGQAFKELVWGKCPRLNELPFVIAYADPSTSNRDKPVSKSRSTNSCKAVFIVGYKDQKFFVYTGFLDTTTNAVFVDWLYTCKDYTAERTQHFTYIENNTLQNPFFEQVLMPLIYHKAKDAGKTILPVTPDSRDKPDKWFRIEGNLEPLNRNGLLILNIEEKDNPNMKRLEAQFKSAGPNSRTMDGPDAIEGAVQIIKNKIATSVIGSIKTYKRAVNEKRY
jgi:hypothetical protein